jgi:PAS domain S-box-containing protein
MTTESSTILRLDLKQQILIVNQMVEQLRDEIQKSGNAIPSRLVLAINQLLNSLSRLNKQVSQLEDDHNNLIALADIGQVVNSSLELDEVLRIVMDTIIQFTGAERGFLMLREDGAGGKLVIHIARNWEKVALDSSEHLISQTVINRVVTDGQPVITTNAQEDERFGKQESIIAYNLRSILCVPLKVRGVVTGVIYADNRIKSGMFNEAKRNLLTAFANQAAVAIENARLFKSVRQTLNEVTDLKNLMDNVFASIASGVITADDEDKVLLCNRATEVILGQKRDEMVNRTLEQVLPPITAELAQLIHTVRTTDQQIVGLEFNPILPDRGQVMLILNLSPLKNAEQATQGVTIVVDDLTDKKRLEKQRSMFERMVSKAVIDQLDPDQLQLGGKRNQITTLFADVRGFTSFSEKYDPEQLVKILNRYLSEAANAILDEVGTIDKFMGDAVMAWFNAPIPQPDHSLRAVRAALSICNSVSKLHQELSPEFHLNFGVGVHFGDAVLGLVGTQNRLEFTAIGDSVNTAKRIQENAAGGQILISETVYAQVADQVIVRQVEPVIAKGKSQPVVVYELLRLK